MRPVGASEAGNPSRPLPPHRSIRPLTSTTPTVQGTIGVSRSGSDESPRAKRRHIRHFWRPTLYLGVIRPTRGEREGPARLRGNMIDEPDESTVLTTRDIEKLLKIPRQTQMDLRARGGFIPHFLAGHRVFYRKEAVLRWISEQEAKAVGADG